MIEKNRLSLVSLATCLMFYICASAVSAQEKPSGTVVFAEGREFTLVRAGVVTRFVPGDGSYMGYALQNGDMLQTGASTFVEVQLRPKGSMLKIAENTSFIFQGIGDAKSETNLNLLYGRVRMKVAKLAGTESFVVRSRNTIAGVRGTDFGFDSLLSPNSASSSSAATVSVYSFSGEVAVTPFVADSAANARSFLVKSGELLAVDLSSSLPVVERRPVDEEIRTYWRSNDFKGKPPIAPPESARLSTVEQKPIFVGSPADKAPAQTATDEVPTPDETQIRYEAPNYEPYRKALSSKGKVIAGALIFGAGALIVQGVGASFIFAGEADTGTPIVLGGSALVGASLLTLATSFFIQTPE